MTRNYYFPPLLIGVIVLLLVTIRPNFQRTNFDLVFVAPDRVQYADGESTATLFCRPGTLTDGVVIAPIEIGLPDDYDIPEHLAGKCFVFGVFYDPCTGKIEGGDARIEIGEQPCP